MTFNPVNRFIYQYLLKMVTINNTANLPVVIHRENAFD